MIFTSVFSSVSVLKLNVRKKIKQSGDDSYGSSSHKNNMETPNAQSWLREILCHTGGQATL